MKFFRSVRFALILAFAGMSADAAWAETSDWMSGKEAFRYADKLGAAGMIVNSMDCRDSGQRGLDVGSALVRLHYTQNTKLLDWTIDGWNHLEQNKKYWADRGYKLVSHTVFVRKTSGLKLYCTVYHK